MGKNLRMLFMADLGLKGEKFVEGCLAGLKLVL